jgi:uncharacterized protein (TIGR02391 family)
MSITFSTSPTSGQIRTLPTAELAFALLGTFKGSPNLNSILRGHQQAHDRNGEPDAEHLLERVADAWAWLVAHGLIGPHHINTDGGWYRVTDRGRRVVELGAIDELLAEQRLPDDLHDNLAEARSQFRSGKAELAVFAAMREVEVRLRTMSGAGNDMIGVALARHALHPDTGPLADSRLEGGERTAISHLFAGALGAFKNPTSHRVVDFDDPAVAADIILLADLLLRLLDASPTTQT